MPEPETGICGTWFVSLYNTQRLLALGDTLHIQHQLHWYVRHVGRVFLGFWLFEYPPSPFPKPQTMMRDGLGH